MPYNIITFGKKRKNLKKAIEYQTIGSFLTTVQDYLYKDSTIFLHCESKIWGTAKVNSNYFCDKTIIWDDKVYPHRFLISEIKLTDDPISLTNGIYNVELRSSFGVGWAYKFLFSPKPLPADIGEKIEKDFVSRRPIEVSAFLEKYV